MLQMWYIVQDADVWMDDVNLKTSDAVTVTYEPQSTPSPTRSRIAFSPDYIKTVPGILKIVEIVSTADKLRFIVVDSSSSPCIAG